MGKDGFIFVVVVSDVQFSDSEVVLFGLGDKSDLILFLYHFTSFSFLVGPVAVALFAILLNQTA